MRGWRWGMMHPPFCLIMKSINNEKIPRHVAIIMDGNGRWAKQRNLSRPEGHAEGVKRVEEIVETAHRMGVKILTLFTFSTENWRRPQSEVNMLMSMLTTVLKGKIAKLKENNIRFQMIGRRDHVAPAVLKTIDEAVAETKNGTGLILNLAFNYGSRREMVDAVKNIAHAVQSGRLNIADISEETISQALYTKGLPDPDLLIRTSGEQRISNFLLWQLSYAEFYFTDKFWPDFNAEEFKKAVADYERRERRYGKLTADT